MKRFIRYFIYRELYRFIRQAGSSATSDSSEPLDPDKPADHVGRSEPTDPIPVAAGPIETVGELKRVLQQMDPYAFEHFVADLWERMGWSAEVSSAAMDEGVDVVATKSSPYDQRVVIQAKRYGPNTTVGSPDIQQYASLIHQYDGVDKVIVVTTNEFTGPAQDLAERLNVKLIDGDGLASLVGDVGGLDLVAEYVDFVSVVDDPDADPDPDPASEPPAVREATGSTSSEGSVDEKSADSGVSDSLPQTVWQRAILAAIPLWIVAFFGVEVLPDVLWLPLFFGVWLGLPVAIYLDSRALSDHGQWPRWPWAYILASLLWLIAVVPAAIYLWQRRSRGGSGGQPRPTESDQPPAATDRSTADTHRSEGGPAERDDSGETSMDTAGDESGDGSAAVDSPGREITVGSATYVAEPVESPDGSFVAATADGTLDGGEGRTGRVFLFDATNTPLFTAEIDRPTGCAVANDGTVAVVEWTGDGGEHGSAMGPGGEGELAGAVHVFSVDGDRLLTHEFEASPGPCAIAPDGTLAAASTLSPDDRTYVFDVGAGTCLTTHENRLESIQSLAFERRNGALMLRLEASDSARAYGIDPAGGVIWKSEELRAADRYDRLLEEAAESDAETAIDLLEAAADLAGEDWEARRVAQQSGEAHWRLARDGETIDPGSDEWWTHMTAAADCYRDALPWYDAKHGLARTLRAMAERHLTEGAEAAALERYAEIERLEAEYSVSLLRPADERRLSELRGEA